MCFVYWLVNMIVMWLCEIIEDDIILFNLVNVKKIMINLKCVYYKIRGLKVYVMIGDLDSM